mmetsp:Transcript_53301/g.151884  ORF Transcript_53301/g.151884 Transcript_53301/m.151884 type:complete len:203 (-) Transcript_53301:370-978(-)
MACAIRTLTSFSLPRAFRKDMLISNCTAHDQLPPSCARLCCDSVHWSLSSAPVSWRWGRTLMESPRSAIERVVWSRERSSSTSWRSANSMARRPTMRCEPSDSPGSLQPCRSTCRHGRRPSRSRTARSSVVQGLAWRLARGVKFGSQLVPSGSPTMSKSSLFRRSSSLVHVRNEPFIARAKLLARSDVCHSGTWSTWPSRFR